MPPPAGTPPPISLPPEAEFPSGKPADDNPFADVVITIVDDIKLKEQATLSPEAREANIKKRRDDIDDEATIFGRGLGSKLAATHNDDAGIQLNEDEKSLVGIMEANGTVFGKAGLLNLVQKRREELSAGGRRDIFTPAGMSNADEGKRRIKGEREYVALQTAMVEMARAAAEKGQFAEVLTACGSVDISIDNAPAWFTTELVKGVNERADGLLQRVSADNPESIGELKSFAKLADSLGDRSNVTNDAAPSVVLWKRVEEAEAKLKEIDAAIKVADKTIKHEARTATMEDDMYQAGIQAGREDLKRLRNKNRWDTEMSNIVVELSRGGGMKETYVLNFGELMKNGLLKEALDEAATDNIATVAYLQKLQILRENPDLFNQAVATLADSQPSDWTGFNRSDYPSPEDWTNYWGTALRREIDGYAIGMLQGATEAEVAVEEGKKPSDGEVRWLDDFRSAVITRSLAILFSGTNFVLDYKKLDMMGQTAAKRLDAYRKSLNGERLARFMGYIKGDKELITAAVTQAKSIREEITGRRQAKLRDEESLLQAISSSSGDIDKAFLNLGAFRDGDLKIARVNLEQFREFQHRDFHVASLIRVGGVGSAQPFFEIPQKEHDSANTVYDRAKARYEELKTLGAKADSQALESARQHFYNAELFVKFIKTLSDKLTQINTTGVRVIKSPGKLGIGTQEKGYFYDSHIRTTMLTGEITEDQVNKYKAECNQLFGENSRYRELKDKHSKLKERMKAARTRDERGNILQGLRNLEYDIPSVARRAYDLAGKYTNKYTVESAFQYTVNKFLTEQVLDFLRGKNLVTDRL